MMTLRFETSETNNLDSYGCCIDTNSFIYCSEIFPSHIRSKGMAWSVGTLFLTTIPYLEAAPTAFAEVGWKHYLLFIILTAINIPVIYFLFPEVCLSTELQFVPFVC